MADRRHRRLALVGRRARGHPDDDVGLGTAGCRRSHRRAPTRTQARHRPHGTAKRNKGLAGLRGCTGALWAGAALERRGQGFRAALLLCRALSLPRRPRAHEARVRRVRAAAHVLGNGLDTPSLPVAPGGHALHRGAAVALDRRQGVDHGPRTLRVARLARGLAQARAAGCPCPANTGFSVRSTSASVPSVGSISA